MKFDREALIEGGVQAALDAGLVENGMPGVGASRHAARHVVDQMLAAIEAGEADYRAFHADPELKEDGSRQDLETCASMLESYGPECFPANPHGQVHFARSMMDATASSIRAYLAANPVPDDAAFSEACAVAGISENEATAFLTAISKATRK